MKSILLTAACVAFGAAATVSAQRSVPSVGTVAPGNPAQNPDFKTLPVVETGLPSFDLPGMTTTTSDAPTGSMVEGFATGTSTSAYSSGDTRETIYNSADRASQPADTQPANPQSVGESDPSESKWIDRDDDGYDPVVDEVEQGVETAVKATGQAAEEVGEEVGELFGNEDPDDVGEEDREGNFLTRGVKSAARNTKKVAKGTVKTTGKVARGTAKTAGKAVKGTAKTTKRVATKPFRNGDNATDGDQMGVEEMDTDRMDVDFDGDGADVQLKGEEGSANPGQPSMGNGGDDADGPNR